MQDDPRVAAYFARKGPWMAELAALRAVLRASGLAEEFKWRGPCYTHAGGNIAFVGAMKAGVSLGFFKGVLLDDPAGLLELPGENSRVARVYRLTSVAQLAAQREELIAVLAQAMRLQAEGAKVSLPEAPPALPSELAAALGADPALAEAFGALTPGRQRGWVITIGSAKTSAGRLARVARAQPKILAGKGIHDR